VPKDHYETLTDMPPGAASDLFERVRLVAEAVEAAVAPDGLNLVQANGEAAGQEVFHAHVHLIPRYENDDVEVRWPAGELTEDEAREIGASIRAELPE
jgi:histidine triad (HIT) family protein